MAIEVVLQAGIVKSSGGPAPSGYRSKAAARGGSPAGRLSSGRSFSEVVSQLRKKDAHAAGAKGSDLWNGLRSHAAAFDSVWRGARAESQKKLKMLAPQNRSFIELQLAVNRMQLHSQIWARTGEAFTGTLQRLQQMGAS